MNYIEFDFETESGEQMEQLIALLDAHGFAGFEESENTLKAYISGEALNEAAFADTIRLFPAISYIESVIENTNWNKRWEESFEPVQVGDFVAVRADFHQPVGQVQYEIVITPKMSFGTGHHATTYLVLQQMQSVNFKNKAVMDFGTGTGVLAILAEKLGAASVEAIDNDEWSIENAKENFGQNHCSKIALEQASVFPAGKKYDIILANITLNVIRENLVLMAWAAHPGAVLLLSGFLKSDEAAIKKALQDAGLNEIRAEQKGEWLAIAACKA